ncbi:MAG: cytochrome c peroxidase [Phycisphaerae bacterium]
MTHRRRIPQRSLSFGIPFALLASAAFADEQPVRYTDRELRRIRQHSPLPDAPRDSTNRVSDDPAAARLGQFLFFDTRLSANERVACVTCHVPDKGFADGRPLAKGLDTMTRHSPTLLNAVHNRWFFWDGRVDSLWAQAVGPIEHPKEHGFSRLGTAHLVGRDPRLRRAYETLFGALPDLSDGDRFPPAGRPAPDDPTHPHHVAWSGMTPDDRATVTRIYVNIAKAIAAYVARLTGGTAPFDVFVEGLRLNDPEKTSAISAAAQRGLKLFVGRANCRLCHSGPMFSDGEFHNTRVAPREGGPTADAGRFAGVDRVLADPFNAAGEYSDDRSAAARAKLDFLTNTPDNWGRFKTPSLRNVALTAPYMHQGQFATLREVLHYYSTLEGALPPGHHRESILAPLGLTAGETDDLLAFLETLTEAPVAESLRAAPSSPLMSER